MCKRGPQMRDVLPRSKWLATEFLLLTRVVRLLKLVSIKNYSAIANQLFALTKISQVVFTSGCLIMDSRYADSSTIAPSGSWPRWFFSFTTPHGRNSPHSRLQLRLTTNLQLKVKVKFKLILRPTVSRPVCLCIKHLSGGPRPDFLFLSDSCMFVDVRRPRWQEERCVVSNCCWPSPAQSFSESRATHDHIILSQIRDSPNLEDQVHIFISPRNRACQFYPQALGPFFFASFDTLTI
jgi:hypothetical protein